MVTQNSRPYVQVLLAPGHFSRKTFMRAVFINVPRRLAASTVVAERFLPTRSPNRSKDRLRLLNHKNGLHV